MKKEAFKLLRTMEQSWWYKGRALVIRSILARAHVVTPIESVLDFGAGFGGMFAELARLSSHVDAFEPEPSVRSIAAQHGYTRTYTTAEESLSKQYGFIGLFDVIEHIEDDEASLRSLHETLTHDGLLAITVPAYQFLWSEHDVSHQHFRRYNKRSLTSLLKDTGYEIITMSYWNTFLFLPAVVVRFLGQSGTSTLNTSGFVNTLLLCIVALESNVLRFCSLPFGVSLIVVARKNNFEKIMQRTITFTADDFGLTRGITDSILDVVDNGPVRLVSIQTNGEAVDYALAEYQKRADFLTIAVHIDLTDGKALLPFSEIPHLVDARGIFVHSLEGLWLRYMFGSRRVREALRCEVHAEMEAQCAIVRRIAGAHGFAVNGHRHVHLVPFVFDELMKIDGVSAIRTVREPFFFCGFPPLVHLVAREVLRLLSRRARGIAHARGILTNDWLVGFLYSGHMTEQRARTGLAHAGEGSIELLFHPGSAKEGEFKGQYAQRSGTVAWHYALERARERETLKNFTHDT